jgi:hypothetical protein
MNNAFLIRALLMDMLSVGLVGCESLFTGPTQNQGAVGGGLSGVSMGSATGQNVSGRSQANALEPGASYIIEANNTQAISGNQSVIAPAQPLSVLARKALISPTADLNGDGFVTLDELLAMKEAGLTDNEMLERLRATNQSFEPTVQQQNYLRNKGFSEYFIEQMQDINGGQRLRVFNAPGGGQSNPPGGVISVPPLEPYPPPAPP